MDKSENIRNKLLHREINFSNRHKRRLVTAKTEAELLELASANPVSPVCGKIEVDMRSGVRNK